MDLTDQQAVRSFIEVERPAYVFLAAARVGGILANNIYRAEYIYSNLVIQNNVIDSSWRCGVNHLLFLESSCIYPRNCRLFTSNIYIDSDGRAYPCLPLFGEQGHGPNAYKVGLQKGMGSL